MNYYEDDDYCNPHELNLNDNTLYVIKPRIDPLIFHDQLGYCMNPDSLARTTSKYETPGSEGCQYLLAERCANQWDGVCDQYYTMNSFDTTRFLPNATSILVDPHVTTASPTLGNMLLINAATLRFFDNLGSTFTEPLNPLDPNSVMVTKYIRPINGFQRPVLSQTRVNSQTIDKDPIIQRLLLSENINRPFLKMLSQHLAVSIDSGADPDLKHTKTMQALKLLVHN